MCKSCVTYLLTYLHPDGSVDIEGYRLHRRDRVGRKGGGVAVYVTTSLESEIWNRQENNKLLEILWVKNELKTSLLGQYITHQTHINIHILK